MGIRVGFGVELEVGSQWRLELCLSGFEWGQEGWSGDWSGDRRVGVEIGVGTGRGSQ